MSERLLHMLNKSVFLNNSSICRVIGAEILLLALSSYDYNSVLDTAVSQHYVDNLIKLNTQTSQLNLVIKSTKELNLSA